MNHRALHGRENALLLLVVLIYGSPPLLPTQKLASFDVTLNARSLSPTAILKGAQDCRLQRPDLEAWGAITGAYLERGAREIMRPRFWGRLP